MIIMSEQTLFPPSDINAERAVLSSMILFANVAAQAIDELKSEEFYSPQHRVIFESCSRLYSEGQPVDTITIKSDLEANQGLGDMNVQLFLTQLLDENAVSGNISHYIDIIQEKHRRRRMLEAASEAVRSTYDPTIPIEDICEKVSSKAFDITEGHRDKTCHKIDVWTRKSMETLALRQAAPVAITGIASGYTTLDKYTLGFQPGSLFIIAARPSIGKSTLVRNIIRQMSVYNKVPTVLFSLEDTGENVVDSIVCAYGHINSDSYKTGHLTEEQYNEVVSKVHPLVYEAPCYIDDDSEHSLQSIRAKTRQLVAETGAKVVFLDFLQTVDCTKEKNLVQREQQVARISRGLKALAKSLKITVVAACQLNRNAEARSDKVPSLADLRESGAIEQDADVVVLLHRPEFSDPTKEVGKIFIIIAKNRCGSTCHPQSMLFIKEENRIEDAYICR